MREFLRETLPLHRDPAERSTSFGIDPAFSRKLGARGWLGMTWPKKYGGQERSFMERYAVIEELIAAGAPVGAHWTADRQTGAQLLRFGSENMRATLLPAIARGELYFSIGMSEPDAGSDLAAIRTRAERVADGWLVNGRKIWNSSGHAHYMIALVRTAKADPERRHAGMSQFLVDLKNTPGLSIRRLTNLTGKPGFCEVLFENALLPERHLLGAEGDGWQQVTAELGDERAGPERYLSSFQLLKHMVDQSSPSDTRAAVALGKLIAEAKTLRNMSLGLAGMIQRREDVVTMGAMYKDLGTTFEQSVPEAATDLFNFDRIDQSGDFARMANQVIQVSPTYSLRGGSREVLRGMIARRLGLR